MFKTVFALLVVDVALLGAWVLWEQPTPDVALVEGYAIPFLAALNGLLAAGLWLGKRPQVAIGFLLNSLLAGAIFHLVLQQWDTHDRRARYQRYTFSQGAKRYELNLLRNEPAFLLSDVTNQPNGTTNLLLMGEYVVHQDTVLLWESNGPRKYYLYQRKLAGFAGSAVPIPLQEIE